MTADETPLWRRHTVHLSRDPSGDAVVTVVTVEEDGTTSTRHVGSTPDWPAAWEIAQRTRRECAREPGATVWFVAGPAPERQS